MKTYKITYTQNFNGDILTGSYIKTVSDEEELYEAKANLFEDPHVTNVKWNEIKD